MSKVKILVSLLPYANRLKNPKEKSIWPWQIFIAPRETGIQDYVGCFCVTAGFGADEAAAKYNEENDDYNSIMVKALADRFAEAYAEFLHYKIRKEYWGYASDENLNNEQMIKEEYKGTRPAPGYPACPDHLEKI